MARYFVPISREEFEGKFGDDTDKKVWEGLWDFRNLEDKVHKDLKVEFDLENVGEDYSPREIMGIRTLSNGLTYRGIMAGGDWELPVFWIVYWDGKRLRGYVPTDGNLYNTDTMRAYGNDPEADGKNLKKRFSGLYSTDLSDEDHWYACEYSLKTDAKKILADIENRIKPRE